MSEPNKKVHLHGYLTDQKLIEKMTDNQGNIINEDLLIKLFKRYLPMIKSLASSCYVRGMDLKDWKQEAALVMINIIKKYDTKRRIHFGAYFRSCLRNHIYDFIRKDNAKKRIPKNCLKSYSANQSYYDDMISDIRATDPEKVMLLNERLRKLLDRCSGFEHQVIIDMLKNRESLTEIAKRHHCSISKVKNASERYRLKYYKMRDNGLD